VLEKTSDKETQLTFPHQGEWIYKDWLRFPDDGWTYEIINGVLHMAPPPTINHQRASTELVTAMRIHAKSNALGEVLPAPAGVRLPNQPVPVQPDILFVSQDRLNIIGTNYVEGAPDLIVEVLSPSNRTHDRETKFNLYQEAGVSEYWLVDYEAKTVEVFTLRQGQYTLVGLYSGGDEVISEALAGFSITPNILFNF
jgi:Uma2 family endonuclease